MSRFSTFKAVAYGTLLALMFAFALTAGNAALSLLGPATPRTAIEPAPQPTTQLQDVAAPSTAEASDREMALVTSGSTAPTPADRK